MTDNVHIIARLMPDGETLWIDEIVTDESYRRRGLATKALRELAQRHTEASYVAANVTSAASLRCFEKALGPAEVLERHGELPIEPNLFGDAYWCVRFPVSP